MPDSATEAAQRAHPTGGDADGDPGQRSAAAADGTASVDGPAGQAEVDDRLHDELRDNARYVNIQYFNAPVSAPGSAFGQSPDGGQHRARTATGAVSAAERDAALRRYVRPEPFGRALAVLRQRRIVVVCGSAGIGKYAGALALLSEVTGGTGLPTNLSPALTFAELAAQKFGNPGGYVVRDHLTDGNATAVQQFEVQRLLGAMGSRSYLVITTDLGARPRGPLADLMVDWAAPDPVRLFDRCAQELPADRARAPEIEIIRERITRYTSPCDVLAVGRMLAEGPDTALAALDNTLQDQVTAWFDGNPTARDVLTVAALAFLDGTPEPVFERWLARLVELHRDVVGPEPMIGAAGVRPADERMAQTRTWTSHGLIRISLADDPQVAGVRCLTFTGGADMRAAIIRTLHERYGYELWEPLRGWLDEVAASPSSPMHVRLALGVALWSRCNFREIEQTFLQSWSNGLAPERLAAACTLSWIGMDGTHASAALGQVKGWAQNSGPRRAVTAASVLGGPLGLRYQSDALRWLWTLAMRQQIIRESAGLALGLLFAAAADDAEATKRMLNFLRRRVAAALSVGESQRVRKVTYQTVLMVLQARDPESGLPVATAVLRQDARNIDRLGELWAELLRVGSLRRDARTALLEALEPISGAADALPAVERLGEAVRTRLPVGHWAALQECLDREARQRADGGAFPDLLAAVLAALGGNRATATRLVRQLPGRTS